MKIEPKATYENSFLGKIFPRRFDQTIEPISGTANTEIRIGELAIWRDTDDGRIYLLYNDSTAGIMSIELV